MLLQRGVGSQEKQADTDGRQQRREAPDAEQCQIDQGDRHRLDDPRWLAAPVGQTLKS